MKMTDEKKIDIIDFIVAEERKKVAEFNPQNNENLTVLNNVNIFKDNNPNGLWLKKHIAIIFQEPADSLIAYKTFLEMLCNKVRFQTSTFALTDKKGKKYYWIAENGKNVTTGFKLHYFEGLNQIISAYRFNLFAFEITLEGLYSEVNK